MVIKKIIHIKSELKNSFGFGKKDSNIFYYTLCRDPIIVGGFNLSHFDLSVSKAI